ncbi:4-hydroxythreonine-4-phosphate dehydrogenase PdxA [Solimicrobium silvestre]|uniref:4-hydroxythreonine-4-phosphate dehydrogenase n=1 Tax=Solimicrobium silvestre TaxID=2099400 RepID=A0A2S9H1B7_9BURK|nr:4-hydroxythreonine-4-phosphate dehydrogenase PdxA [Solimicrobium silvestre]PRC93758.1 pdxA: 4-hydroxythreonine-4-phosphate dehydrogenase PdxA [Solimicrobium silvestre]
MIPTLAITVGEPAGIGPEISLRAAWQKRSECHSVLIGDIDFLRVLARQIDPAMVLDSIADLSQISKRNSHTDTALTVLHSPLAVSVIPGTLDARNGLAVLATLDLAIAGAMQGQFDAIVTAPLQKSTINDAGMPFSGHTEYLAEQTHIKKVVMMLACSKTHTQNRALRVALATTHLPLRAVADAINFNELTQIIDIIHADLQSKFGIQQPVILVAGLNPHAGENGYLGCEEIDIIAPAIVAAQARQIDVRGPYPADTLFQEKYLEQADCVLAMYHDQGLPVLKYASFGMGVNITLGLPMIRTSVDHGTALDLAARGVGHADLGSMLEAIDVAVAMTKTKSITK